MDKNRIARPTRCGELAQHREAVGFSRGGKCGGRVELGEWVRRRVRLYYWKQWKRPRTRRRQLLALGVSPEVAHLATRSRKGYWRMSANRVVQRALTNRWLHAQGVPDMRTLWIALHYGPKARI